MYNSSPTVTDRIRFISRRSSRPFASLGNPTFPIASQCHPLHRIPRLTYIGLVGNNAHDGGNHNNVDETDLGGSGSPSEVHVSVLLHGY